MTCSRKRLWIVLAVVALVGAVWGRAVGEAEEPEPKAPAKEPRLEILPEKPPEPEDNPTTPEKVALGKQLYFDARLSGDNTMSCATCHLPDKAFTDGRARAKGHEGKILGRNTPTSLNVGYLSRFFWDGRAGSLEEQALGPIQSPDEMNQDLGELVEELEAIPGYAEQFRKVFGERVTAKNIGKAIAAFERTLVTRNSPLDRYLAGDKSALTPIQKRGMELFTGAAGCVRCHHGPMLTDEEYYRIGVSFNDRGRAEVTDDDDDQFAFRTPPLRDISETGPYMHDGSHETLYDVIIFYMRNVPLEGPDGKPLDVTTNMDVSLNDVNALQHFLRALKGEPPEVEVPELP